ncbi:MAG: DUF2149 domain-containing protein [Clostridiales bacterium]
MAGTGKLRHGKYRSKNMDQEINPMDGVANLADVMLVLACGLMLSLIVSFNVDVGRSEKLVGIEQGASVELDADMDKSPTETLTSDGYQELGKVYQDPKTGKLYMVSNK